MAKLFETIRNNITMHIKNIFEDGELQEKTVSKDSLLTAKDGKNYKTKFYNLDLIIAVGYRVKSVQNKMHYAVHGNTAAEVIFNRVDSEKENIGLTMGEDIKRLK